MGELRPRAVGWKSRNVIGTGMDRVFVTSIVTVGPSRAAFEINAISLKIVFLFSRIFRPLMIGSLQFYNGFWAPKETGITPLVDGGNVQRCTHLVRHTVACQTDR